MNLLSEPYISPAWKQSAYILPAPGFGQISGRNATRSLLSKSKADQAAIELSSELLRCLFRHRRLLPEAGICAIKPCSHCLAPHLPKIRRFIERQEPIHLILPAFPAKSPSARKTLGPLPDRAEELALEALQNLCDEIQSLYAPGARLTLCADGRVFNDLVGVTEENVTRYAHGIRAMIARLGLDALDMFHLEDRFTEGSFQAMRDLLETEYAESPIPFATRIQRENPALLNGIERFLLEESAPASPTQSKTRARKWARERAFQVVRRSEAWGRLIAERFPAALRLSIHPQQPHASKIGIGMGDCGSDVWITPWHGVAVLEAGQWTFCKREAAEALGARLVERAGQPYYYSVETKDEGTERP